jgi:uncharacterized protein with GYD domain
VNCASVSDRSAKAFALIKKHGGKLKAGYALLGDVELVLIVEIPDIGQAMKTSATLAKLIGTASSTAEAVCIWLNPNFPLQTIQDLAGIDYGMANTSSVTR